MLTWLGSGINHSYYQGYGDIDRNKIAAPRNGDCYLDLEAQTLATYNTHDDGTGEWVELG